MKEIKVLGPEVSAGGDFFLSSVCILYMWINVCFIFHE